jgi:hypothetical protein
MMSELQASKAIFVDHGEGLVDQSTAVSPLESLATLQGRIRKLTTKASKEMMTEAFSYWIPLTKNDPAYQPFHATVCNLLHTVIHTVDTGRMRAGYSMSQQIVYADKIFFFEPIYPIYTFGNYSLEHFTQLNMLA